MNDLKQLKDVQVDPAKKQRNFDQVSARMQKSVLPWQVPMVLLGVVIIGFFLFLTWSEPRQITANSEPKLTAVYSVYGEGNPYSIGQMWVTRSTNTAVLNEYKARLREAKHIEKWDGDADLSTVYRFVYSDGTFVRYEAYYTNGYHYLYDVTNERYFEITNKDRYYNIGQMDDYNDSKQYFNLYIFGLVLYFLADYFVGRKMRDEPDKKKRLPIHSTHWQIVVTVSAFSLIAFFAFIIPNLHYFVAVTIMIFAMLCHILLEQKFGQNHWRMLNFIIMGCWNTLILITFFLWI